MGLFSSKKIIQVSSSLFNLAGDVNDRPDFLKANLFGAIMADDGRYLGETITQNYLQGPGIKQRQMFRSAQRNNYAGLPSVSIRRQVAVDPDVVRPFITVPAGQELHMQSCYVEDGDLTLFAEKWLMENHPNRLTEEWTADYSATSGSIVIMYPDSTSDSFVTDFDPQGRYVVADHFFTAEEVVHPVVQGTRVNGVTESNLPVRTDNQVIVSEDTDIENVTLSRTAQTVVTYSDSRPGSDTSAAANVTVPYQNRRIVEEWVQTINGGGVGYTLRTHTLTMWTNATKVTGYSNVQTTNEDIGGGVTRTTTVTTTGQQIETRWDYRQDTQDTDKGPVQGGEQKFIYKIGGGQSVLDALDQNVDSSGFTEFFPVIPIRLNNASIRDGKFSADTGNGLYTEANKMYRKATSNKSFGKIIDQIEDHEKVGDMDYVYQTYGVPLNVLDNSARIYLYDFWKSLMQFQNTSPTEMDNFKNTANGYLAALQQLDAWQAAQAGDDERGGNNNNPLRGTPRPVVPTMTNPETTTLQLRCQDPRLSDYDNRISWINISEQVGINGTYLLRAAEGSVPEIRTKKGEVHVVKGENFTWQERQGYRERDYEGYRTIEKSIDAIYIIHQTSDTEYNMLTIYGAVHNNYIYGGKSVRISAHEAIDDAEESGFLCPIHFPTMKAMSLKHSTQMTTANTYLVINAYVVKKIKWYQRGIFKIILIIAIVVISVLVNPGAFAAAGGILGGNLAVGAALGLTGTAAIVAGAVANAIAAIVIAQVIGKVATELFGAKWGAIIAAIVTFVVTMGFSAGFGAGFSWGTLTSAQGILQFTNALANGYSGWTQANIAEINDTMVTNQSAYEKEMKRLEAMIANLGGNSGLEFNPMSLTEADTGNGSYLPESVDEFIHRTTMTGSDVVDITLRMVSDYTSLALVLPEN